MIFLINRNMRMKCILFCLLAIGAVLPYHSAAQYVGWDDVFPDRAGKVIAFKATYSGATDRFTLLMWLQASSQKGWRTGVLD